MRLFLTGRDEGTFSAEICFRCIQRKISAVGVFIIFALSKRPYGELTRKFIYPLRAFTTHLGLYSIAEIHLVPPTDGGQSVNSDWCCFPLSLSGQWGWQERCMKTRGEEERKKERWGVRGGWGVEKKKIKLAEKQMPGCALAYPLSAKETQQQIAALHC